MREASAAQSLGCILQSPNTDLCSNHGSCVLVANSSLLADDHTGYGAGIAYCQCGSAWVGIGDFIPSSQVLSDCGINWLVIRLLWIPCALVALYLWLICMRYFIREVIASYDVSAPGPKPNPLERGAVGTTNIGTVNNNTAATAAGATTHNKVMASPQQQGIVIHVRRVVPIDRTTQHLEGTSRLSRMRQEFALRLKRLPTLMSLFSIGFRLDIISYTLVAACMLIDITIDAFYALWVCLIFG
jgi:hypothetical protein